MTDGIEIIANSAIEQISRLNSATYNIANVNTPGFKAERFSLLTESTEGVTNEAIPLLEPEIYVDYSQGNIQKTGNALDLAISGKGFFAVKTEDGTAYTRDGRFTLNEDGALVTQAGDFVLGRQGKIIISGNDIQISQEGLISVDGNEVGELKIVSFCELSALVKLNMGLYSDPDNLAGAKEAAESKIQSEYLEHSNVQAIREMVEMINIQRTFESYQTVLQTISEQDEMSIERIGDL
jgi:flagellar basal-body rod protein FlgF